eukprot:SAG11_NODE_2263_length_3607_cov_3.882839_1_plen_464_part_00
MPAVGTCYTSLPATENPASTPTPSELGSYSGHAGWLRGLIALSAAFFCQFTAWHATQNLQSTRPFPSSVSGTTALAIVYISSTVTNPIAPRVVHSLKPKRCIVFGMLCYGCFIAGQLIPRPWTLYPAALLVGSSGSVLWAAQGVLITHLAVGYSRAQQTLAGDASHTGTFHGIFQCSYQAVTTIIGSLLTSLAFIAGGKNADESPTEGTIDAMFTGFLVFIVFGILFVCFGLPAPYGTPARQDLAKTSVFQGICNMLSLLKQPRMYMLVPLLASAGLLSALTNADYTREVVVPALGFDALGFVLAINALGGAIAFVLMGRLADYAGRSAVVLVGLLSYSVMIIGLLWFPLLPPGSWVVVCAMGVAGEVGAAALTVGIVAHLSARFLDERTADAFANKGLIGNAGQAISFLASEGVPMRPKLYAYSAVTLLGVVCYCVETRYGGHAPERPAVRNDSGRSTRWRP